MHDEDDQDSKKPHPVSIWRKSESDLEADEHGPKKVDPDGKGNDLHSHMHVRC
ncbi:MAG TPA: hypothetical protein VNO30_23865 [Kofleriaceae bacterium]|nr:hypothetical protein [Kofleriaceae bacterium]